MEIQVEKTSTQSIKPSVPTLPHLRLLKLSLVDQLALWAHNPTIFFYSAPDPKYNYGTGDIISNTSSLVVRLRESLSETLSLFYPVAGRFTTDESAIDCNDEGIPFIEARANCTLDDFLKESNRAEFLQYFLPISETMALGADPRRRDIMPPREEIVKELVLFAVQVTLFKCGGLAIGCLGNHRLFDGNSLRLLLNAWSSVAAERVGLGDASIVPDFTTAPSIFTPPQSSGTHNELPKGVVPVTMCPIKGGECIAKPFTFTSKAIAELRDKARSDKIPNPTRVESVSAFIWKHAMAATMKSNGSSGRSVVIQAVNIRPHTSPPLPILSMGNLLMYGYAYDDGRCQDEEANIADLAAGIREGIARARDPQLLKELLGEKGNELVLQSRKHRAGLHNDTELHRFRFSSWGRFDMDFGFGVPVWTGVIGGRLSSIFRNIVILVGTSDGGIEAWVVLKEHVMANLESDSDFLAFASPSP